MSRSDSPVGATSPSALVLYYHSKFTLTLSTPKWKSPCPAAPRDADKLGVGSVTTCSGAASSEYRTPSVRFVQSTCTAKLCQETAEKGVSNRMFSAWSRTLNECAFGAGSVPVGSVKGEPAYIASTTNVITKLQSERRTELDFKHVRSVTRLDEHNLVLMGVVQGPLWVLLDAEVEHSLARLECRVQIIVVPVVRGDEFRAAETKLRATTAGKEDRGIVNRYGDDLFTRQDNCFVPQWRGRLAVPQERRILHQLSHEC